MKNAAVSKFLTVYAVLLLFVASPLFALEFNLVDGEPIHNQAQMDALHTGDTLVMTCPNCHAGKMVTYSSDASSPGHVNWMKPGTTFTCKQCGAKLTAVEKDGRIYYECSKCHALGGVTAFKTSGK